MKKLIAVVLILGLVSCGQVKRNSVQNESIVINEISQGLSDNPKIVKYYIDNSWRRISFDFCYFYDSVGKYNVGDTIKLSK